MKSAAFRMLYDNIHDFKNAAVHVESEIARYALRSDSDDIVPGTNGLTHVDMWASMKTVSHFNLGIALELMLKLLLLQNNLPIPRHHCLAKLHKKLPKKCKMQLESTYQASRGHVLPDGHKVVAYNHDKPGRFPPNDPNLWTIKNAFIYFDSDAMFATKRYTWEHVEKGMWHHYISDIEAFVELISRVIRDIERP